MSDEKVLLPAYVRIGVCKECGADVYAAKGGGLPLMSSCSCAESARRFMSTSGEAVRKREPRDAGRGAAEKAA